MPKFKFQLQPVLTHRSIIERQRQRELAEALAEIVPLQNMLAAIDVEVRSATEYIRTQLKGRIDMGVMASHRRFMGAQQRRAMEIVQRMQLKQRAVDEARARLAEAAKNKKIIEKLRERAMESWTEEQVRKETVELDEVAMQMRTAEMQNEQAMTQTTTDTHAAVAPSGGTHA